MEREAFSKLVEDGFQALPAWVREKIHNVALLVEEEPSDAVRAQEQLGPDETLLGLYQGTPQTARNWSDGVTIPDTITLYQKPIEQMAAEESVAVEKIIADTLWHEFAHHFGMDEDEVRDREQKRKNS